MEVKVRVKRLVRGVKSPVGRRGLRVAIVAGCNWSEVPGGGGGGNFCTCSSHNGSSVSAKMG